MSFSEDIVQKSLGKKDESFPKTILIFGEKMSVEPGFNEPHMEIEILILDGK